MTAGFQQDLHDLEKHTNLLNIRYNQTFPVSSKGQNFVEKLKANQGQEPSLETAIIYVVKDFISVCVFSTTLLRHWLCQLEIFLQNRNFKTI